MAPYEDERALYSGWGIEKNIRNQGDELCHQAALMLLEAHGVTGLTDVRNSINPIIEPWDKPLIVGGGTVLPTVFEPWVGPGLKSSPEIYFFGSGCLSKDELDLKGIVDFDREPYGRADIIGLRGPLSVKNYQDLFGVTTDYIGDLAFAFARETPTPQESDSVSFFLVENNLSSSRVTASFDGILNSYAELCQDDTLKNTQKIFSTTDRGHNIYNEMGLHRFFDRHNRVITANDMVNTISSSRLVVTERLHPAIVAANHGVPFVYLQTTSKSLDLQMLLNSQRNGISFDGCFRLGDSNNLSLAEQCNVAMENKDLPYLLIDSAQQIKQRLNQGAKELAERLTI